MIQGRADHRTLALLGVACLAPTLAVGFARFLPAGPASASASSDDSTHEPAPMLPRADIAAVERTGKQQAMTVAADLATRSGWNENPFRTDADDLIADDLIAGDPIGTVIVDDAPVLPDAPVFRLTAIIAGRRTVAVIDGAVRTAGDGLGNGWSIASIDADAQTVVLRHKVLGDKSLSLRRP